MLRWKKICIEEELDLYVITLSLSPLYHHLEFRFTDLVTYWSPLGSFLNDLKHMTINYLTISLLLPHQGPRQKLGIIVQSGMCMSLALSFQLTHLAHPPIPIWSVLNSACLFKSNVSPQGFKAPPLF